MWFKIFFSVLAVIFGIIGFIPYFKDIFTRKTNPHAFTWMIWGITQSTALVGIWYGGGGWGALGLTIGTFFVIIIFILSLRWGEKNITRSDIIVLCTALLAIVVWWLLENPVLSIIMVTAIDLSGFIPTFRKSFIKPYSETISSWLIFALSNICAIIALQSYNLLTLTYILSLAVAEISLVIFLAIRRKSIKKI